MKKHNEKRESKATERRERKRDGDEKPTMPRIPAKNQHNMSLAPQPTVDLPATVQSGKMKPGGKKQPKTQTLRAVKVRKGRKGRKGTGEDFSG